MDNTPATMGVRKRTQASIAGSVESIRLAVTLGRDLKAGRERIRIDQGELGRRVGLSQSRISAVERGLGVGLPLGTWVALGIAVKRPLAVSFSRALDEAPADGGHLDIQEGLVRALARHRWPTQVELATRPTDPRHSVDVAARDGDGRYILLEGWNRFGDLGAAIRSTQRKEAELRALAPDGDVRACWVIRATAANRALLRRYPGIFRSSFPGSSLAWAHAINDGTEPPRERGVVWWWEGRAVAVRWPGSGSRHGVGGA